MASCCGELPINTRSHPRSPWHSALRCIPLPGTFAVRSLDKANARYGRTYSRALFSFIHLRECRWPMGYNSPLKPGVDHSWPAALFLFPAPILGGSTSKQCLGPFPAFSHRPCIRSTLYYCDQVGGGIQQMQICTSAFQVRQILFFYPSFSIPSFFSFTHSTHLSSQQRLSPSEYWPPAGSGSGCFGVGDAAGSGVAPSRQRLVQRLPYGSTGSGRHGARPVTTTGGGRGAQSP